LLTGGVPLLESLQILKQQMRSNRIKSVLDSVIDDISNGQSLAKATAKFPRLWSPFAVGLIKVGEASGTLNQNLTYLADELKKKYELRRKTISALIYPIFITISTLAITAFLTLYLFPKLMPVFLSLHMQLPLTTRVVIGASNFLKHWGLV